MHLPSRPWLPAIAIAAAGVIAAGLTGTASAGPVPTAPGLARPAADHPELRGPIAPLGEAVTGLTGSAAAHAAGTAADGFRKLADERAKSAAKARTLADEYLHTAWGTWFTRSDGQGLRATHSVFTGAAAATHGGDVVYAPTALPPGGACMEMTTAYTSDGPVLWAWDWCGGDSGIGKLVDIDAGFLATYTTVVNGSPAYSTDVHRTDAAANTWTSYLYNYTTHAWDVFYTSSGSFDLPDTSWGWDFFEIYSTRNPATGQAWYCGSMPGQRFEASDIEVNLNGTWTPAAPAVTDPIGTPPAGSTFDCPALTFTVVHPNDDWVATIG